MILVCVGVLQGLRQWPLAFFTLGRKVLYVNNMKIKFVSPIEFMDHQSFTKFKTFCSCDFKKNSKTSFPKSRRNFKICKAQLPDHKRCCLGGIRVCLSFRKPKLWNGWAFEASYVR